MSTEQTHFDANYGHNSKLDILASTSNTNLATKDLAKHLSEIQDILNLELEQVKYLYKTCAYPLL